MDDDLLPTIHVPKGYCDAAISGGPQHGEISEDGLMFMCKTDWPNSEFMEPSEVDLQDKLISDNAVLNPELFEGESRSSLRSLR